MQGHRSVIGSLPETLDFDHGSSSGNAFVDPQICWNSLRNPADSRLADFILSPSHMTGAFVNSVDQERQGPSEWNLGEPSSSGLRNEAIHDEHKREHGWSSSVSAYSGPGPRLEERRYGPTNILPFNSVHVDSQFMQSSNSDGMTQNLNLNAGPVTHGIDNFPFMEASGNKASWTGNEHAPSSSGYDSLLLAPGTSGYSVEQQDDRPGCPVDGRPCKRKAVEINVGQSSIGGSSSFFQSSEQNAWPGVPACYDANSSLSMGAQPELFNARLGIGARGLACDGSPDLEMARRTESSHRNFRLVINPANEESVPPALFPTGSATRRSGIPSSHHSSRLIPVDHSLNLRSFPTVDGASSVSQQAGVPVPALVQNSQSFRWNEIPSSRVGSSSSSIILCDAEEANSRSRGSNVWEHSVTVPATELRASTRIPAPAHVTGGNINGPGNVSSSSWTAPNTGVHPLAAPTWIPQPNPPRNSRRLAEYVRRSLSNSAVGEAGGQSSSRSPPQPGLTSSGDMPHSSNNHGHHRSHARSASRLERQGDSVLGIPYPLRTLATTREGRSRLVVSEIRNVLDVIRRGESLRIEDFMLLDQSVFFGVADIHDRHRDMRLDVDNMSYEELLALEERIGNVNTGLSEETILRHLKQRKHSVKMGAEGETEPCCICREEYNEGEDIGKLDCGHDFHTGCIKQWLMLKNWCPICKTTGLTT
ncbi:hypothetical protein K2173_028046 [Erythroxylum novogranatense]|uniref:RING-type E3 ubiquitin transferase n=1 Tax=Erythroxylum novogranatense TaxID=1862640 RepID=A0AAV8U3R2_9ROSI|nr:hypothetical protein K2173_028046 [Erythroxylum novogranatense]